MASSGLAAAAAHAGPQLGGSRDSAARGRASRAQGRTRRAGVQGSGSLGASVSWPSGLLSPALRARSGALIARAAVGKRVDAREKAQEGGVDEAMEKASKSARDRALREDIERFDTAVLVARAGRGGAGALLEPSKRWKNKDGSKMAPEALPSGGPGGSVVVMADASLTSLEHLQGRVRGGPASSSSEQEKVGRRGLAADQEKNTSTVTYTVTAGKGGNVPKNGEFPRSKFEAKLPTYGQGERGAAGKDVVVRVPPGTRIKKRRGGKFVADLNADGDGVVVARGGAGGASTILVGTRSTAGRVNIPELKKGAEGRPGEEDTLELILSVVADVALIGLPNAGKSSTLAALTRARPEVADYPFTTLVPNLGVVEMSPRLEVNGGAGSVDAEGAISDPFGYGISVEGDDVPGFGMGVAYNKPTIADLPGLIEGAHRGRGLGRTFLKHVRRAKVLVHIVDASAEDPAGDLDALRQELRLYNPEYTARPHVVSLNKADMLAGGDGERERLLESVRIMYEGRPAKESRPSGVELTSARTGEGLSALLKALDFALAEATGGGRTADVDAPTGSKGVSKGDAISEAGQTSIPIDVRVRINASDDTEKAAREKGAISWLDEAQLAEVERLTSLTDDQGLW